MNNDPAALPPLKVLQAALRKITEELACELACPTDIAPDWSDFEWRLARAVAALHGVSPLLASRLNWDGPSGWKLFLQAQKTHVARRHRRIENLLSQLDALGREHGVAMVGLKGAALHAMGLYIAGERPMADIDLLVQPQDCQRAAAVLGSLGFTESFANWKHRVFMPEVRATHADMGEHALNYLKIELHERIAEILPLRTTDVTQLVFPLRARPGLNAYPSNAALMIHLLIHAASAMAYRALRLLHLHDIALVAARMTVSDWDELLRQAQSIGGAGWALPPLQLTARYYGRLIPEHAAAALTRHSRWNLRHIARHKTLAEVSLSYLWIEAFPGIGWSRSVAEMLEYIIRRIRPGKEVLYLRKVMVQTQVALSQSEWDGLSQKQRMLRWLLSRQARSDTLHAVRRALQPTL